MNLSFSDVAGLLEQKKALYTSLVLPTEKKELYSVLVKQPDKIRLRNNFLFYGPPGTGKTFLAQALAQELKTEYVAAQATQFLNPYVGRGSETLRNLYEQTNGIIFIDEIDAIASKRGSKNKSNDDVLIQLLLVLDSVATSNVKASIFATNKKDDLDDALLSRIPLANQLYFNLPDQEQRESILNLKLSYFSTSIRSTKNLAKITKHYDARALEDIVFYASTCALQQNSSTINEKHLYQALEAIHYGKK
jgi:ATP-dependent 26S proteasome regulatory subunit